jgi:magnesium transporter
MSYKVINGKSFVWWHFNELEESDFEVLEQNFKFHPLDFDDIRDENELSKLDSYKYYLFLVLNIPLFDARKNSINKRNLSIFIGKDYVVTISKKPIEPVARLFSRAERSSGMRRDALGGTTGYFLYRLIDYIYRDMKVVLRELVREAEDIEGSVYDKNTRVATAKLGLVRRNVLFLRHMIDPHKFVVDQLMASNRSFLPKSTEIYFDDIRDTLNSMTVVLDNLRNIVDSLFDVNESFLSHRTNEIIRVLTIISVLLLPPTLVTSFYGMNVRNLPFEDNVGVVFGIIMVSLISFAILIFRLDRRK